MILGTFYTLKSAGYISVIFVVLSYFSFFNMSIASIELNLSSLLACHGASKTLLYHVKKYIIIGVKSENTIL